MKITIIDGEPKTTQIPDRSYRDWVQQVAVALRAEGHEVEHLRLACLRLQHCTGCWSCWMKTPGRCASRDDTEVVLRSYLQADLVLFATPLRLGFLSAELKTLLDKLVTLFLPHIQTHQGEFIHSKRYDRYPALGCLLHSGDFDAEDLEITTEYFRRYAFHFQTELAVQAYTTQTAEEVCHALRHR